MVNYYDMIVEIDEKGEGLTPWELDFISDLVDAERDSYTAKQERTIIRIYEQRVH